MSIEQRRRRFSQPGFTLIELIVFIVIISVGLAGVLLALNSTVRSSADPLQTKQALAIAEALLEEVLLSNFNDPDGIGGEARGAYDDVQDFDTAGGGATVIATNSVGTAWPTGYTPSVAVTATTTGPPGSTVNAFQITVTVAYGGNSVAVTGYRAQY